MAMDCSRELSHLPPLITFYDYDTRRVFFSQQLYIACRFFTISQVATDIVGLNVTNVINCKARFSHALLPKFVILTHPPFSHRSG